MSLTKRQMKNRRKARIKKKIRGSSDCPRLTVYRSLRYVYAQIIDDESGKTIASASSLKKKAGGNIEAAKEVGAEIAAKAKEKQVSQVRFDRNGYIYHGVVKSLADSAREGGLSF